jgi:hypothetical protein
MVESKTKKAVYIDKQHENTKYEWISDIRNNEMKISKAQLKQLIKEETEALVEETGRAEFTQPDRPFVPPLQPGEMDTIYSTLVQELAGVVDNHFGTKNLGPLVFACIRAMIEGKSVGPLTPSQREGLTRDLIGLSNTGAILNKDGNETRKEMPRWKSK